jgi:hypothetical protein
MIKMYIGTFTISDAIKLADRRSLVIFQSREWPEGSKDNRDVRIIPAIEDREIFLLDEEGQPIWQIEEAHPALRKQNGGGYYGGSGQYCEIRKEGDKYYAFTWSGFKVEINMDDGTITYVSWSK